MKLKSKITYPKFFITLSLALLVLGAGLWAHQARPFSHFVEMDRDGDEKGVAKPQAYWQAWFNRGRRSPDKHPAAYYRLRALDQKSRLPHWPWPGFFQGGGGGHGYPVSFSLTLDPSPGARLRLDRTGARA